MTDHFSKADKKVASTVSDLALQRDFNRILNECHELLNKWKIEKPGDKRLTYGSLYQTIRENDQYIAGRYDALSGSRYFNTIVGLLVDEILSPEDLTGFSSEARQDLLKMAEHFKNL